MAARRGGPGPNAYDLPTTIGYEKHDFTRMRNPAFSMGNKSQAVTKTVGPGPTYTLGPYTRFGKVGVPAYSIGHSLKERSAFNGPGPGTYAPENVKPMKEPRPPAYSMGSRTVAHKRDDTPGPNAYNMPSFLGPKVPNKEASAAYTMGNRTQPVKGFESPGPAAYPIAKMDVYKEKRPQYSLAARERNISTGTQKPGPAEYTLNYNTSKNPPMYSFGVKHSEYSPPLVTEDDNL